ncbi:MAG: hypothetical protein HY319_29250 [Armatimonadetes bacterium]|nr:hypothetical protein [Armatimonadota bacterium]
MDLLAELQHLTYTLRTTPLAGVQLGEGLRDHTRRLTREAGLEVDLRLPESLQTVGGLAGTFLFRIVQEALVNARRHAGASRVTVDLHDHGTEVLGVIADDGRGFEPARFLTQPSNRFGIRGMKERAELLGGSFEVESSPGKGTRIRLRLPLDDR